MGTKMVKQTRQGAKTRGGPLQESVGIGSHILLALGQGENPQKNSRSLYSQKGGAQVADLEKERNLLTSPVREQPREGENCQYTNSRRSLDVKSFPQTSAEKSRRGSSDELRPLQWIKIRQVALEKTEGARSGLTSTDTTLE